MFENTMNVGVAVGLSMALSVVAASSAAVSDSPPIPSLRSLDLQINVRESSQDLGGAVSSATVLTGPVLDVVPGIIPVREVAGRWVTRPDVPSLIEMMDDARGELLIEASSLEVPDFRLMVPARGIPGRGVMVLGLR